MRLEQDGSVLSDHSEAREKCLKFLQGRLAGEGREGHLLQPSNVLPEELSLTDKGTLINCYSWLTGSQPLHTQGTFLAGALQINRHPCPRAGYKPQHHVGLCFMFRLRSLKQFYF